GAGRRVDRGRDLRSGVPFVPRGCRALLSLARAGLGDSLRTRRGGRASTLQSAGAARLDAARSEPPLAQESLPAAALPPDGAEPSAHRASYARPRSVGARLRDPARADFTSRLLVDLAASAGNSGAAAADPGSPNGSSSRARPLVRHRRAPALKRSRALRVALLGSRGIPASYGGYETLMEELAPRLVARGFEVTVYCRSHYTPKGLTSHLGARLVVLPTIRSKHLDTPVHSFFSCLHAGREGFDAALMVNSANAMFLPLLSGTPVALNVDGIEKRRAKW